jgi:hypothetical protein
VNREGEVIPFPGMEHLAAPAPDVNPGLAKAALVVTMEEMLYELVKDRDARRLLLLQLSLIEVEYFKKLDRLTDRGSDEDHS